MPSAVDNDTWGSHFSALRPCARSYWFSRRLPSVAAKAREVAAVMCFFIHKHVLSMCHVAGKTEHWEVTARLRPEPLLWPIICVRSLIH